MVADTTTTGAEATPSTEELAATKPGPPLTNAKSAKRRPQRREVIAMTEKVPSSPSWRPVVGWEGLYEVHTSGRVRSVERFIIAADGQRRTLPGQLLLGWDNDRGYPVVQLCCAGKEKARPVHQLVAEAFIGPRPPGLVVCHNDGDPHNNTPENLRYDTRSNNNLDAVRQGTHKLSSRTHCLYGHEFTPENTAYQKSRQGRVCRECVVRRHVESRAKKVSA